MVSTMTVEHKFILKISMPGKLGNLTLLPTDIKLTHTV